LFLQTNEVFYVLQAQMSLLDFQIKTASMLQPLPRGGLRMKTAAGYTKRRLREPLSLSVTLKGSVTATAMPRILARLPVAFQFNISAFLIWNWNQTVLVIKASLTFLAPTKA
jgi:hypothetical protein